MILGQCFVPVQGCCVLLVSRTRKVYKSLLSQNDSKYESTRKSPKIEIAGRIAKGVYRGVYLSPIVRSVTDGHLGFTPFSLETGDCHCMIPHTYGHHAYEYRSYSIHSLESAISAGCVEQRHLKLRTSSARFVSAGENSAHVVHCRWRMPFGERALFE